jgi:hypothetical protein
MLGISRSYVDVNGIELAQNKIYQWFCLLTNAMSESSLRS